jgi:hypothetical protein
MPNKKLLFGSCLEGLEASEPIIFNFIFSVLSCLHNSIHYIIFSDKIILNNALDVEKGSSDIRSALKYFNSITEYMMQLRGSLRELRDDIE